jgi:Rrf2 family protein
MRLTTKGRFAVTAMIDLAMRNQTGPVTLAEISGRQKISLSYLEQLFGKLRRKGLVSSVRGPGGGYNLARKMEGLSVADIILAVDEPIDATQCGGQGELPRRSQVPDARPVGDAERAHLRLPAFGDACQLVEKQLQRSNAAA